MIKHKTPKLVAQAALQKLRSDYDLSKVICVDVSNKEFLTCIETVESSVNKALESKRFKTLQTTALSG
jgi:hypothetical protein